MVSLLAILLPAVFGVPSCRTEKKPDLRLSAYTWEIDVDDSNRLYEGSTVISNEGKGVLKIDYVNTGCSCTNAVLSKQELKYRDTTAVRFSYNPRGKRPGTHEEFIVIKANTDTMVHLIKLVINIK